jgi:maltose alpha-D-glucosyltransferase/alpha-amylase
LPIIIEKEDEVEQGDEKLIGAFQLNNEKYFINEAVGSAYFREKMLMQFFNGRKSEKTDADYAMLFNTTLKPSDKLKKSEIIGRSRLIDTRKGNHAIAFNQDYFLKMYRRLDKAPNPDYETIRFLTEQTDFENIPKYKGEITWANGNSFTSVMGLLQEYVPNQGSAKLYFEDVIRRYYERVISVRQAHRADDIEIDLFEHVDEEGKFDWFEEVVGNVVLERAALLGTLTARLHKDLASKPHITGFEIEDFSLHYQKSLFSALQSAVRQTLHLTKKLESEYPESTVQVFQQLQANKTKIVDMLKGLQSEKIDTKKTRIHGNLHLGNVIFTGKDFYFNDFEGDATRAFSEKRLKKSPLKDIASLIRSFHYAAYHAIFIRGIIRKEDVPFAQEWSQKWYKYVSNQFFNSYYEQMEGSLILPKEKAHTKLLLDVFMIERALYELRVELSKKSDKALLPAIAINELVEGL